jgi:hypothetical protein
MKNILVIVLVFAFAATLAAASQRMAFFDFPIKKMHAEPRHDAHVVYEIPIEVRMLGVSEDRNWYKVRISFDLVFFGKYEYTGWCFAPIGDLINENEQR